MDVPIFDITSERSVITIVVMEKSISRSIQEFVPGKQVTLAHLIAHPTDDLSKKIGVPGADAIGIMTLTPGETSMIAADIATKAADVQIGFLDRFTGSLVIYGTVGAVEEALRRVVDVLASQLQYSPCALTRT
jgi:ethanolamine utilization protein EutS